MQEMLQRFMLFYNDFESRPVFATVEEMLKWTGLHGLTRRTLEEELLDAGLNSRTIAELVTVCFFFSTSHALCFHNLVGTFLDTIYSQNSKVLFHAFFWKMLSVLLPEKPRSI